MDALIEARVWVTDVAGVNLHLLVEQLAADGALYPTARLNADRTSIKVGFALEGVASRLEAHDAAIDLVRAALDPAGYHDPGHAQIRVRVTE